MTDLRSPYLGLLLRSPIVASAGPLTARVETCKQLVDAGAAALVLPSLFEEQVEHDLLELDRLFELHAEAFSEGAAMFDTSGPSILDTHLTRIEETKAAVDVPVIASLNGTTVGGWLRYGRMMEEAGADAIELNLYSVAADPALPAIDVEAQQLEVVASLCEQVSIPVAVKLSPYYSSLGAFALGLQDAGAAGVVLFNRFYLPDFDLDSLELAPKLTLSHPDEVRLPLRWIGILSEFVSLSLAGSSGVDCSDEVVKLLLAGADVAMTTSAVLRRGPRHVATIEAGLVRWMDEHGYESVDELRGAARLDTTDDPAAYHRANYVGNLSTFTSRYLREGVTAF